MPDHAKRRRVPPDVFHETSSCCLYPANEAPSLNETAQTQSTASVPQGDDSNRHTDPAFYDSTVDHRSLRGRLRFRHDAPLPRRVTHRTTKQKRSSGGRRSIHSSPPPKKRPRRHHCRRRGSSSTTAKHRRHTTSAGIAINPRDMADPPSSLRWPSDKKHRWISTPTVTQFPSLCRRVAWWKRQSSLDGDALDVLRSLHYLRASRQLLLSDVSWKCDDHPGAEVDDATLQRLLGDGIGDEANREPPEPVELVATYIIQFCVLAVLVAGTVLLMGCYVGIFVAHPVVHFNAVAEMQFGLMSFQQSSNDSHRLHDLRPRRLLLLSDSHDGPRSSVLDRDDLCDDVPTTPNLVLCIKLAHIDSLLLPSVLVYLQTTVLWVPRPFRHHLTVDHITSGSIGMFAHVAKSWDVAHGTENVNVSRSVWFHWVLTHEAFAIPPPTNTRVSPSPGIKLWKLFSTRVLLEHEMYSGHHTLLIETPVCEGFRPMLSRLRNECRLYGSLLLGMIIQNERGVSSVAEQAAATAILPTAVSCSPPPST